MFHDFLNYLSHEVKLWSTPAPIEELDEIYVDEIFGFVIRFFESLGIYIHYGEMQKGGKSEIDDNKPNDDFFNFYSVLDKKEGNTIKEFSCFELTSEQMRQHIILKCFEVLYRRENNNNDESITIQ